MQMLHLHDFITDHLADRERAMRKRERKRLDKVSREVDYKFKNLTTSKDTRAWTQQTRRTGS
jgi:hypothetical protein